MLFDAHAPGELVGFRFRLEDRLGGGAFGSVWRALDVETGELVAIKILYDRFRGDRKVLQRFAQEARLLARLDHPGIARSIAWSVDGAHAFLAMEYIRGITLAERIARHSATGRPFPLRGVIWLGDQLSSAAAHAHAHGVIHRDLKPTNVMVNEPRRRPFLKVLDFGIAKVLGATEIDPTTGGRVLGSILYLAPEQIRRAPPDARTDVFAIATMLFELLTLRRAWARDAEGAPLPFDRRVEVGSGNDQFGVLHRIAREERPRASPLRDGVPPAVDEVLARGMAVEPGERFATPAELALAFRIAMTDSSPACDVITAVAPPPDQPEEEDVTLRDPLGMLETLPELRIARG